MGIAGVVVALSLVMLLCSQAYRRIAQPSCCVNLDQKGAPANEIEAHFLTYR